MSERTRQAVDVEMEEESIEEKPAPPEEPTPGGKRKRERPSLSDMLFREAEIIAQNLKESGTRR